MNTMKKIISAIGALTMMVGCFFTGWDFYGPVQYMQSDHGPIVMLCGAAALILGISGKSGVASIGGWLSGLLAASDFTIVNQSREPGIALPVIFIGAAILISAAFIAPERNAPAGLTPPPASPEPPSPTAPNSAKRTPTNWFWRFLETSGFRVVSPHEFKQQQQQRKQ
jgi:hypothetical protein